MKMAARSPLAILGAASCQTMKFRGESETESGSTSPNMSTSLPVGASRMKYALESYTQTCSRSWNPPGEDCVKDERKSDEGPAAAFEPGTCRGPIIVDDPS